MGKEKKESPPHPLIHSQDIQMWNLFHTEFAVVIFVSGFCPQVEVIQQ